MSSSMFKSTFVSRILALVSVARSQSFPTQAKRRLEWGTLSSRPRVAAATRVEGSAVFFTLLLALFALLALPAMQAHAQAISGSVAAPPVIDTLAGDAAGGYNGDDIAATLAELNCPFGVAVDNAGNTYIADASNNRIRVVAAKTGTIFGQSVTGGDIYTVAGGGGTPGTFSGDGGLATIAELSSPYGVALDSAGDLYISDNCNNRIRVVAAKTGTLFGQSVTAGDIYTVAGDGRYGYAGDSGPATKAELNGSVGVALDNAGNLYIADFSNSRIRVVAAKTGKIFGQSVTVGDIYTVAGDGTANFSGDDGPATSAELNLPTGVAVDSAGDLYIADRNNLRIRMVAAGTGTLSGQSVTANYIYTVAGNGTGVYSGDGGPATSAGLDYPCGVAVDSAGNTYITDTSNNRIRMVAAGTGTLSGQSVTANYIYTVAGDGTVNFSGDGGPATIAGLDYPIGVAVDSAGNLYIADANNNRIRKVSANTIQPTTAVAATSASQNVFVQLTSASAISSINIPKAQNGAQEFTVGAVTNCATNGTSNPIDTICTVPITFNPQYPGVRSGELTLYNISNTVLGTVGLSGMGNGPLGIFQPGTASVLSTGSLTLKYPRSVAVDGAGDRYIADDNNNRIVEVTAGGVASVLSTGSPGGTALSNPNGVAVDGAGNIYIVDNGNHRVLKSMPDGGTSVLSTGSLTLSYPTGVAVDGAGDVYIADTDNNRIVEVTVGGVASVLSTGSLTLSFVQGVAVDGAGDVYIADGGGNRVVEVTVGGVASVLSTGSLTLSNPVGVAVDGAGDAYIADTNNTRVVEVTAGGVVSVLSTGSLTLSFPSGVAVDGAGDVYVADNSNNRVVEVNQSAQSLSFASTMVGSTSAPQTVSMQNIGNQTLTFTALSSSTTNFTLNGATTCDTTTPLVLGATCDLEVEFDPVAVGSPLTGTVNITDNSMNAVAPNNMQQIPLSGTGTSTPAATPTFSPAAGTYSSTQSVTIGDATSNHTIYYTTNGTTPTTSSSVYSGPITVSATETVEAIAVATGYTTSAVGSAAYTITLPIAPSFTMTSSPNTMSIAPGATTGNSTSLTLATTNYSGAVTLTCSGLPANAYCSFPGNTGARSQVVTLSGSNMNVALNIETSVATAPPLARMQGMPSPFGPGYSPANPSSPLSPILPALAFWWPGSMAGLAAFGRKRGISKARQRMLQLCLLVLMTGALAAGISGCGGSSSSTPAATHNTPAGNFTVTVTATPASGTAPTTTITLTIT